MDMLFAPPTSLALAALCGILALAILGRADLLFLRARRARSGGPMLGPIRAWRWLILGIAVAIGAAGFGTGQAWLVLFALVLGFVEVLEASMMVSALADERF